MTRPIQPRRRTRPTGAGIVAGDDLATETVRVKVRRLAHAQGLELPAQHSRGSAGLDLRAALPGRESVVLEPGERTQVPTGLELEIPPGWEGQVRPRSGLAKRHGLALVNSPGTIDSDYRGEVQILVINLGDQTVALTHGQRIAQLIVAPVPNVEIEEVESLSETRRGAGGFGSTG